MVGLLVYSCLWAAFAMTDDHRNGNKQVARALCFMRVTREPERGERKTY